MLCLYSRYFYEVISELDKEGKGTGSAIELEIPLVDKIKTYFNSEINVDGEIDIILKFIYNNGDFSKILNQLSPNNCLELFSLCKSLGIELLNEKLSFYIIRDLLKKENSIKMYLDSKKVLKI